MRTADAMGCDISAGLAVMTADIARQPLSIEQIARALERCRLEMRGTNGFPPRLTTPDILERAGIFHGEEATKLEAIAAWDLVVAVAEVHARWRDGSWVLTRRVGPPAPDCAECQGQGMIMGEKVVETIHGQKPVTMARECGCKPITPIPDMSQRILDVVKRMGGWGTFAEIDKHHFVKKQFAAEFTAWEKVEQVRLNLPANEGRRLDTDLRHGLSSPKVELAGVREKLLAPG